MIKVRNFFITWLLYRNIFFTCKITSLIHFFIYGHFSKTDHEILPEYFEVVQSVKQRNELKIAESIDIHRF